jgi:hypothetical protein
LQTGNLLRAEIDTRCGAIACTACDEVNYLFIQKAKEEVKEILLYCALKSDSEQEKLNFLRSTLRVLGLASVLNQTFITIFYGRLFC